MAIPGYMWLRDDTGAEIRGSVQIAGREGSCEVQSMDHQLYIPLDPATGQPTGTRRHQPIVVTKPIDSATPFLLKAVAEGQTLTEVEIKHYSISDDGREVEFYNMQMEGVKVLSVKTELLNVKYPENATIPLREKVTFTYRRIIWTIVDGNLQFSDSVIDRA